MSLFSDIGGTIGSIIGSNKADQGYADAKAAQNEYLKYLQGINPEATSSISQDPTVRQAQLLALQGLQNIANQKGMDLQSRVAETQATDTANQTERAQRAAVMADAAARGTLGGGQELASKLMAQQGAANRASTAGADFASQARQRALQALQGAGQEAGNIARTDLGYQTSKDQIAEFNARNRLGMADIMGKPYTTLGNLAVGQGTNEQQAYGNIGTGIGTSIDDIGGTIKKGVSAFS